MAITEVDKKEEIYSDFQNTFAMHPIKKELIRVTNEEAVKRSIKNIINTNYYERPFRPRFGANIRKYLFENMTPIILQSIKTDIIAAINNYEPRANIVDVIVYGSDNNSVEITIIFSIINSLQPITLTTTLTVDRVR